MPNPYYNAYAQRSYNTPYGNSDYLSSSRRPRAEYAQDSSARGGPRHREPSQPHNTGAGFYSSPQYTSQRGFSSHQPSSRSHHHRSDRFNMNHLTSSFAGLGMDSSRSRHRSGGARESSNRNVHWHDRTMPHAPEVPRVMLPHQVNYSVDRASRGNSSYRDQQADATRYMNAQRSVPHYGHPLDGHGSSRRHGDDGSSRRRRSTGGGGASRGFRDRIRRFF